MGTYPARKITLDTVLLPLAEQELWSPALLRNRMGSVGIAGRGGRHRSLLSWMKFL